MNLVKKISFLLGFVGFVVAVAENQCYVESEWNGSTDGNGAMYGVVKSIGIGSGGDVRVKMTPYGDRCLSESITEADREACKINERVIFTFRLDDDIKKARYATLLTAFSTRAKVYLTVDENCDSNSYGSFVKSVTAGQNGYN